MKKLKRKSPLRLLTLSLAAAVLAYLCAGLLPCMFPPPYPQASPADWPASSEYADAALPVESGEDSLALRLALIRSARERIRLGTYLFGVDQSGTEVMAALYRAAERGVRVDILTDGILGVFNFHDDPLVYALGSHDNVTIHLYNPVDLSWPWEMNRRYHEKYLLSDGEYALVGGRNVADEFLIEDTAGYSIDLEVLVKRTGDGRSACDLLAERFDAMIASPHCAAAYEKAAGPKAAQALETLRTRPVGEGADLSRLSLLPVRRSVLLASSFEPWDKTPDVMAGLAYFASLAEESLIWCSPYFCPDAPMLGVLHRCAALPRCTMITNSAATGNNIIASADGVLHRRDLNSLPCEVWEVQAEHSLHTKALVIDRRLTVSGTFNMDMRSAYLDTELMLVLDSPDLALRIEKNLTALTDTAAPVSAKALAAGRGAERAPIPFLKQAKIFLMAPIAALIRYLI